MGDFRFANEVVLYFGGNEVLLQEDQATPERVRVKCVGSRDKWVYGTAREALHTVSGLAQTDPLIEGVIDALERDRRAPLGGAASRHEALEIVVPGGEMFHVSPRANRESILRFGLDWRRMAREPGIARSERPEAEAVYLGNDDFPVDMFVSFGLRDGRAVDVWAVTMKGRWVRVEQGSWPMCFDPLEPARLRLVASYAREDGQSKPIRG